MKLSEFAIDTVRLETGDWVENIPDCDDLRIKTRGVNNADYRRLFQTLVNATPRKERRSGLSPERNRAIIVECLVATCLLDWENLEGVPFSKDKALELLSDRRYERLFDACLHAASVVAEERAEDHGDDVKNSSGGSNGHAPGAATRKQSTV